MEITKKTIEEVEARLNRIYNAKPRPLSGIFGRSVWKAIAQMQPNPEVKKAMLAWNEFPVFVDKDGSWSLFRPDQSE